MSSSSNTAAATSHLNQTHTSQILAYLAFFSSKLSSNQKEIDAVFEEQKDIQCLEEMYTLDDVTHILDTLKGLVKSQVNEEFTKFTQQSVLYLRQLFLQAEGNGVALNVDLSTLEDAVLLSGIEKLDLDRKSGKISASMDLPETRRLNSLQPVNGTVDIKLVTQIKDLQEANKNLLLKFEKLQTQCTSSQKEAIELREKNERLDSELSTTTNDLKNLKSSNKSAQQQEIDSLRQELSAMKEAHEKSVTDLKAELKSQNDTLNSKVNNAPQYQQLKKLMNTKNEQLKEARARVKTLEEHMTNSKNAN